MTRSITGSNPLHVLARTRVNPFYARAVAAQPGYLEAVALRDKAQSMQRSLQFPAVVWPDPPTAATANLDDYLAAYTAAWDEEQTRTRNIDALGTVIGACERAVRSAIDDPDNLLTILSADMDELMAEIESAVSKLKGATTPIEAINADTSTAWRELAPLRDTYDSLRHAQTLVLLDAPVMNHRSPHIDDPLADDTHIANLDDVFPGWHDPDNRFAMQGTPDDRRPWPADPLEQLVWFVNSPAELWIPTTSDLDALHAKRRDRLNPMPDNDPTPIGATR
jgi:hypothetical protein